LDGSNSCPEATSGGEGRSDERIGDFGHLDNRYSFRCLPREDYASKRTRERNQDGGSEDLDNGHSIRCLPREDYEGRSIRR
jgi:hypothetical protein